MDLLAQQMNEVLNQCNCFSGKADILRNIADGNVYRQNSEGNTQLHLVLQNLHVKEDVVKQLLDMGAPLNTTNYQGQSPLHCAVRYKNCELSIVRLLVNRGADIHLIDHYELTPLFHAVFNPNCPTDVIEFFLENGVSVHSQTEWFNVLHYALIHKPTSFDVIKLLLDKGANVHTVNPLGESALHLAAMFGRYDVVKVLLKIPKIQINLPEKEGFTPLHVATMSTESDSRIVKLLLEAGANVKKKSKHGEQPLHLAAYGCHNRQSTEVKMLLKYGARVNAVDKIYDTPLLIAVKKSQRYNRVVVKSLLDAGALVYGNHPNQKIYPDFGWNPLSHYCPMYSTVDLYNREQSEDTLQRVKLLLKYSLLEKPCLPYKTFIVSEETQQVLLNFGYQCTRELQSVCIKPNVTLAQFILRLRLREEEECKTDEILDILAANVYPLYKEVLLGLLTRREWKDGFQHHMVYTVIDRSKQNKNPERVELDFDSICKIEKYLIDEDLVNLLLALYDSNKKNVSPIEFSTPSNTLLDEIELESKRFIKRARIN